MRDNDADMRSGLSVITKLLHNFYETLCLRLRSAQTIASFIALIHRKTMARLIALNHRKTMARLIALNHHILV
jgi:hypothetical protein